MSGQGLTGSPRGPTTYGALQQNRVEISEELLRGSNASTVTKDVFGRNVRNVDSKSYAFLLFVCAETLFVLIYCFWSLRANMPVTEATRGDVMYTTVVIINTAFAAYFAVNGVLKERVIELYIFVAASLLLTVYVIYEYSVYVRSGAPAPPGWKRYLPEIRLVLDCLCEPVNIFFSLYVARSFGWVNFLTVGADADIARMYDTMCTFAAFAKINFQMFISYICLSFLSQAQAFRFEFVIETFAALAVISANAIAIYMYPREKPMFRYWAACAAVQPLYVAWKTAEITALFPATYKGYVKAPSLFLGAVNAVTFTLMFAWAVQAYRNFGKGLYEKAHGYS